MKEGPIPLAARCTAFLICLALLTPPALGGDAASPTRQPPLKPSLVPGGEIFDAPTLLEFRLHLRAAHLRALREQPREYVPMTAVVNGQIFTNVAAKLKGAAGSFRPIDDQPALTLHFSKWVDGRRLFGIRRLHLNNSVQDPSFLNEYLGSELFRAAGVPTTRVAWATVELNDRKLGLYVLKEAFETEFLRTCFGSAKGNLYDGGFVQDIQNDLELDSGDGPKDRSDLKALAAALQEQDRDRRWERLEALLDVDRFASYAALSVMLVDWDGYPLNRNNYRIYFRPDDGRAVFMPHGMDQLFQRSYLDLDVSWTGSVAWALFDIPVAQTLYEARCRELFTNVFQLDRITNSIARACAVLQPVQPDIRQRAQDLEDQVYNRFRVLRRDAILKPPPPRKP